MYFATVRLCNPRASLHACDDQGKEMVLNVHEGNDVAFDFGASIRSVLAF
jgi:hypothetical protein